jgi:hypothetical protein
MWWRDHPKALSQHSGAPGRQAGIGQRVGRSGQHAAAFRHKQPLNVVGRIGHLASDGLARGRNCT